MADDDVGKRAAVAATAAAATAAESFGELKKAIWFWESKGGGRSEVSCFKLLIDVSLPKLLF